ALADFGGRPGPSAVERKYLPLKPVVQEIGTHPRQTVDLFGEKLKPDLELARILGGIAAYRGQNRRQMPPRVRIERLKRSNRGGRVGQVHAVGFTLNGDRDRLMAQQPRSRVDRESMPSAAEPGLLEVLAERPRDHARDQGP